MQAKARKDKRYSPPTEEGTISTHDWLLAAADVARQVAEEEVKQLPAWWFNADGGADGAATSSTAAVGSSANANSTTTTTTPSGGRIGMVASYVTPPQRGKRKLHYMRASTDHKSASVNAWISKDLKYFNAAGVAEDPQAAAESPFFILDPAQQRGVHCRFGMPGIIAEAHYDGGRNFITMARGRKRYILSPPSECPNLHLLKDGPSARHSEVGTLHELLLLLVHALLLVLLLVSV